MKLGVYIRSVGERTESLCYESVAQYIPKENIHIIRNIYPSYNAFWKMFQHARTKNYDWFLGIDADIILRPNWLDFFQQTIRNPLSETVFRVRFKVLDYISQKELIRGNNWYNGKYIKLTHKYFLFIYLLNRFFHWGRFLGVHPHLYLKPESTLAVFFDRLAGITESEASTPIGWHGYEQTYTEIFRQYHIRRNREPEYAQRYDLRFLTEKPQNNTELLIAYLGWNYPEKLFSIDARNKRRIKEYLELQLITEETSPPPSLADFYKKNKLFTTENNIQTYPLQKKFAFNRKTLIHISPDWLRIMIHKVFYYLVQIISPVVYFTKPISNNSLAPTAVCTLLGKKDLYIYIFAIKSLLRFHNNIGINIHDDGTLQEKDFIVLKKHLPHANIWDNQQATTNIEKILYKYPSIKTFRASRVITRQVIDIPLLANTQKIIIMDSDILFLKKPKEIIDWCCSTKQTILYAYEPTPTGPLYEKKNILYKKDFPFSFAPNLCGGFICCLKNIYILEKMELYCAWVLQNCQEQIFRAQTISANMIAQSKYPACILPKTYQNPHHIFFENVTMRHYWRKTHASPTYMLDILIVFFTLLFYKRQSC